MKKNCIAHIMSPTHLLSFLSAIKSLHNLKNIKVVVIVYWPGSSSALASNIGKVITTITKNFSVVKKVVILSERQYQQLLKSNNIDAAKTSFAKYTDKLDFDEIYYPHDVVGSMYQFLCSIYPEAQRVCIGDALGSVFEKNVFLSFLKFEIKLSQPSKSETLTKLLVKLKKILELKKSPELLFKNLSEKTFKPHKAALVLPADQSGHFLKDVKLTICKKKDFLDIIHQCIKSTRDLQKYIYQLLTIYKDQNKWLLLTETHAEANFIDFNKEIEMWCSIINNNITSGDVVFIKSHPGATLPRNEAIKKVLGNKYQIVELKKDFERFPIELWKDLVSNCDIVCMSYAALSLKYIYNIDVIQVLNNRIIEKYFLEWSWDYYKNSLNYYSKLYNKLNSWDGKSVL